MNPFASIPESGEVDALPPQRLPRVLLFAQSPKNETLP